MTNINPTTPTITARLDQLEATVAQAEVQSAIAQPVTAVQAPVAKKIEKAKVFQCPGHTELFHRYMSLAKAEKKADKEVEDLKKDKDIKSASYKIVEKKSEPKCGFFNGLNKIYKCAVVITTHHADGSKKCPLHPNHKKA